MMVFLAQPHDMLKLFIFIQSRIINKISFQKELSYEEKANLARSKNRHFLNYVVMPDLESFKR